MANLDLGKIIVPVVGGVAIAAAGVLLADYIQKQGWIGMRTRAMPGRIIRDAKPGYGHYSMKYHKGALPEYGPQSYPAYGPYSMKFDNGSFPEYGPAYAYNTDPFYKVGRNSQSRYESGDTFHSMPALSNIDRNYDRVFTDRYPQGLRGPILESPFA